MAQTETPKQTQEKTPVFPAQTQITINLKPLRQVRETLEQIYVGRQNEVVAVLAGLLSGEPVILVGPPGTAKTAIIEALSRLIDARYFYYLLNKFTEPDELLGPLDIVALRQGQYKRITSGRLPEAELIFLDEIFKASSAIRNTLLDIILNKRFLNGTAYVNLPVLAIYTASNEVSTDEEDQAFYDRLVIRAFVDYVAETEWEELVVRGVSTTYGNTNLPKLANVEYVKQLQAATRQRAVAIAQTEAYRKKVIEALAELKKQGIEVSDRRKVKLFAVISAVSIIWQEPQVSLDSLADALRLVAVYERDDLQKVEAVIKQLNLSSTEVKKVGIILSEIPRLLDSAKNGDLKAIEALRIHCNELARIRKEAEKRGGRLKALTTKIENTTKKLQELGICKQLTY